MILSGITLSNFRNHTASAAEFGPGINALFGDNGQGKTNVLEAVSYLSLTKSFYAASDADVLQIGKDAFEVQGSMVSDGGVPHGVRAAYTRMPAVKTFAIDGAAPLTMASVIGRFPVVILSPENSAITFGGPSERRKFIDMTLSQISSVYLDDLLEYRRVLKQRNRILSDARLHGHLKGGPAGGTPVGTVPVAGLIEPWTEGLIRYGSRIAHRRRIFLEEFRAYLRAAYHDLVPSAEEPEAVYRCSFDSGDAADPGAMGERMRADLDARKSEELKRGLTLAGPHRDDLTLTINGIGVQQFASQGQHKTLLVALKVAEYMYVRERRQETPLFLLDDVFSELDDRRAHKILGLAMGLGQSMITTTDQSVFDGSVGWGENNRRFTVEGGTCRLV